MGKVIQGSFLGGQPRLPVQPSIAPPPRRIVPPPALPRMTPPPAQATTAGRSPGPPAPAFAGQPVQRCGAGGAFAVEAQSLGLVGTGGRTLPDAVRGKMEAALGADFSGVRVHVGSQAERIGAIAFTVGSDIYFAPGRYQPDTIQGQQLLGHELAHVVQQRAGRVRNPLRSGLAVVQDRALEAEADRLGRRAATHRIIAQPKASPKSHGRTPAGQRFAKAAHTGFFAPRRPGATRIQRYTIVPWTGDTAEFLAQVESGEITNNPRAFLKDDHLARVKAPSPAGEIYLRVSDDGEMAIEHSDLSRRQAKCFFATQKVIDASSGLRGEVRLANTGKTITVGSKTLHQIVPRALNADWPDAPDDPKTRRKRIAAIQFRQNCNNIAEQISGLFNLAGRSANIEAVFAITGTDEQKYNAEFDEADKKNKALLEERVKSDPAVVKKQKKLDLLDARLKALSASLRAQQESFTGWAGRAVGWVQEKRGLPNEYDETVNRLTREIAQLRGKIRHKEGSASLAREAAYHAASQDDTIEKVQQSPLWRLAKRYVRLIQRLEREDPARLQEAGINEYAEANLGDVYQISHIGTSKTRLREETALYDFKSGNTISTSWGWHFATVVAVSGGDRVTLENFARGDFRGGNPDPRWYFQMYGSKRGQSFHEETASTGTYANPVTVVHKDG